MTMILPRIIVVITAIANGAWAFSSPSLPSRPVASGIQSHLSPHEDGSVVSRRDAWKKSVATFISTSAVLLNNPILAGAADIDSLETYQDADTKFSLKVPSGWEKTVQSLPDRRQIILYVKPDSAQKTLIFFAFTPVRDDFTSLGSFGSVDEVGQATILPKSTLAGLDDVESKMLEAESKKQAYFFDYVQKIPSQPKTHFRTIFSLATGATGGAGNVLVTITAQTPESDYEQLKPLFDEILDSYKPK